MPDDWHATIDWNPPVKVDMKVVPMRRRRWPRRDADQLVREGGELQGYVKGTAHNRQMQMYAMGARDALRWALGGTQAPTGNLSCTETALGWRQRKGRSRLKTAPAFVRKRRKE